jgi:hypothetical protein
MIRAVPPTPVRFTFLAVALLALIAAAGCGSSKSKSGGAATPAPAQSEAKSAATGDIPDNQVFVTLRNAAAGYTIRYPEGWAQRGAGRDVTLEDKDNRVHVVVSSGGLPTDAQVVAELGALARRDPTLKASAPKRVTISGSPAFKVFYSRQSEPNPVTGKRVLLVVDRYELARGGRRATVDLATAKGVDNVDAHRMMIASFRWR